MHQSTITLQVYHHYYKIPLEEYFNSVTDFPNPWDERAYQNFIQKRLDEANDNGIVGMVRQENDEKFIYLDAAVRYPQVMDDQVSL